MMQENHKVANATQETKFRVGQTVWCLLYGKGEVEGVDSSARNYSVYVQFKEAGGGVWYTHDGKCVITGNRTLFFSEPHVIAATEPVFEPKLVGKTVAVTEKGRLDLEMVIGEVMGEDEDTFTIRHCNYDKRRYDVYELNPQPITFD